MPTPPAPFPTRTLKRLRRFIVQITPNTTGTYHVEHAVWHVVRRDSSTSEFGRVVFAFISACCD